MVCKGQETTCHSSTTTGKTKAQLSNDSSVKEASMDTMRIPCITCMSTSTSETRRGVCGRHRE
eukprot:2672328-Prorocentrum_lima.AAC.1